MSLIILNSGKNLSHYLLLSHNQKVGQNSIKSYIEQKHEILAYLFHDRNPFHIETSPLICSDMAY